MADDLFYPDLSGNEANKQWIQSVRDAIRILFDSVYELGGRKGQAAVFSNQLQLDGDLAVSREGGGLRIAETGDLGIAGESRSSATMGIVKLKAGAATVLSTLVHQESRIFLTPQDGTGTGTLAISTRETGKSFTISSSDGADERTVAWLIVQPHGAADTVAQEPTTESKDSQTRQRNQRDPDWVREYNRRLGRTML